MRSTTFGVCSIATAMIIALTGCAMADQVVPQVPEAQGISTTTSMSVQGTVTETDAIAWTLSGTNSTASSGSTPMLQSGQVQYTTAYDKSIQAINGQTTYVGSLGTNTANKVISQSNVDAKTSLQFIPTSEGGVAIGSENIMIDGVGNTTAASDRMLCPFSSAGGDVIPAYCNIVQSGSSFELNLGSVVTSANDRFVGSDATAPVVLNYNINVKGITLTDGTTAPALGSASAYIKAHIQEGRGNTTTPQKAEDLTYAETSSVSGIINSFAKGMSYQSGKSLLP